MNAKEYFEQMCKEAGLDDSSTAALIATVSSEKLSGRMNSLVKTATEDYNAQIGRVRAADEKVKQYDAWYGTASGEFAAAQAELTKTKTQLAALAGVSGGNPNPESNGEQKYLTASDLAAFAKEQGTRLANVVKETARLASRHASKWGEELDVDALDKIAQEQNVSLTEAYNRLLKPRVDEKEAQTKKDWEKTTREEIERDIRSRFQLPVDTTPPAPAPVFATRPTTPPDSNAMNAELVGVWNAAAKP